jgi:SPP1 gp7 family putative phage head morphogenesis protein
MEYWARRNLLSQFNKTSKSIEEIEEQLIKYYGKAQEKIIGQFIEIYEKVLSNIEEGKTPTAADLYKLDTYWQGQTQLRDILKELGNVEAEMLSEAFTKQYTEVYEAIALPGVETFSTMDLTIAHEIINQVWCADGKSWSERIWDNTAELAQTLEYELTQCLVTGKKTTELKNILQDRFNVSYHRADMLVRTEMAHIQNEAARKRYEDNGITEYEIWAPKDERQCNHCGTLHRKRYPAGSMLPVPAHPNCRCTVLPVII